MNIELLIEATPHLERCIKHGAVAMQAMVYVNAANGKGLDVFMSDMEEAGIDTDKLVEGVHYVLNPAYSECLRPYTGSVWIKAANASDEFLREIAPMLLERQSEPRFDVEGNLHIYNNPLFRTCARLGLWEKDSSWQDFGCEARAFVRDHKAEKIIAETKYKTASASVHAAEVQIAKAENVAACLRKGKFFESAKDHSAKASRLKQRVRALKGMLKFIEKAYPDLFAS